MQEGKLQPERPRPKKEIKALERIGGREKKDTLWSDGFESVKYTNYFIALHAGSKQSILTKRVEG